MQLSRNASGKLSIQALSRLLLSLLLFLNMNFSYNGETFVQNHKNTVHTHGSSSLGNLDNKVLALGGYKVNNPELEAGFQIYSESRKALI